LNKNLDNENYQTVHFNNLTTVDFNVCRKPGMQMMHTSTGK